MTPKEKANALLIEFYSKVSGIDLMHIIKIYDYQMGDNHVKTAIQCAILCVDEILNDKEDAIDVMLDDREISITQSSMKYWQEVKSELLKM